MTSNPAMRQPLRIEMARVSHAVVRLCVAGCVDLATAPHLRRELLALLRDRSIRKIAVSLAGVTFLDCAGVGALIAARNDAARTRRQVWVSEAAPVVPLVLASADLLSVLSRPAGATFHTGHRGLSRWSVTADGVTTDGRRVRRRGHPRTSGPNRY